MRRTKLVDREIRVDYDPSMSNRSTEVIGRKGMTFKFVRHFTYDGREADLEVENIRLGHEGAGVTLRVKFLQEVVDTEQRSFWEGNDVNGARRDVEVVTHRRKEGRMIELEMERSELKALITALEVFT